MRHPCFLLLAGLMVAFAATTAARAATEITIVSATEVPLGGVPTRNATKLAADGTVVGNDGTGNAWRWLPGEPAVEEIGGEPALVITNLLPRITADGSIISMTRTVEDEEGFLDGVPSIWTEAGGWAPLPGLVMDTSIGLNLSVDGTWMVGSGRNEGMVEDKPWIWSAGAGQEVLPMSPGMPGGEGHGVSADGSVVIGTQWDLEGEDEWRPQRNFATRWVDGQPQLLHDGSGGHLGQALACSSDCTVVVGGLQGGDPDFDHPNFQQAWYWSEAAGGVYLGSLVEAAPFQPYYAIDVNADGNIIVGTYYVEHDDDSGFVYTTHRGFIWTEATGMAAIPTLLADYGLDDENWYDMLPSAITPAGDKVLLTGTDNALAARAMVLDLSFGGGDGPPQYQAILLPQLDPGNGGARRSTQPSGINNARVVTGNTASGHGFIWNPQDGGTLLQPLFPDQAEQAAGVAINAAGTVAGSYLPPGEGFVASQAFIFSSDGAFEALPPYTQGLQAGAADINDAGWVVGSAETEQGGPLGGPATAVYWLDGELHDIGGFGGFLSRAFAINNHNVIVGYANTPEVQFPRPFRWTESGGMEALPVLSENTDAAPHAINDSGIIVGEAVIQVAASAAAVYWDAAGDIHPLPHVHASAIYAAAHAINNPGLIVGRELPVEGGGFEARLWVDGVAYHLQDQVSGLPENFRLTAATGINDNGDIIATGVIDDPEVDVPDIIGVLLVPAVEEDAMFGDRFEATTGQP